MDLSHNQSLSLSKSPGFLSLSDMANVKKPAMLQGVGVGLVKGYKVANDILLGKLINYKHL